MSRSSVHHVCLSIEGALKTFTRRDWENIAKDNGMGGPDYAKWEFQNMHRDGLKVLPFGKPCEGFSYQTGCPGHPKEPKHE